MSMPELTAEQARQSELISDLRTQVTTVLDARTLLKQDREMIVSQYAAGIDPAAFAGANGDLTADDLMPALAAFDALESVLIDPATGQPTPNLIALVKLRRVRAGR
jgi:uncharacterized protein (DUF433 family)